MTSLLEKIVAIIAPHACISCGRIDNVWCLECRKAEHIALAPVCVVCGTEQQDWRLCEVCCVHTGLTAIWSSAAYGGVVKDIIHKLKFERVRDAHEPLAEILLETLPQRDWTIVPIPTAPPRIRMRGYDQAALLARYIAKERSLTYSPALIRVQDVQQVGKNRMQRQHQSAQMFAMHPKVNMEGAHVLLVDDVCTTASTLAAAARVLRSAGATEVCGAVVAWRVVDNAAK